DQPAVAAEIDDRGDAFRHRVIPIGAPGTASAAAIEQDVDDAGGRFISAIHAEDDRQPVADIAAAAVAGLEQEKHGNKQDAHPQGRCSADPEKPCDHRRMPASAPLLVAISFASTSASTRATSGAFSIALSRELTGEAGGLRQVDAGA